MDFAFDLEIFFIWRCHNIMKVAQAKIEMIKPEEVNMDERLVWAGAHRGVCLHVCCHVW